MIIDEKIQIAMNINTTIKELYELVEDKNTKVIQAILYRPFLPLDFLMKISEHKSVSIRAILAQHPKTPKVILEKLFQSLEHKVLASLAKNHNTPEEYLIKLSKYESKIINNAISTNPNAPVGILKELNVFSDSKIIKSFLKNQDLSSALVTAILEYSDFNDKDIVKQKNISVSQLDRFININQSLNVLETIASHPNADAYILDKIIETQKKGNFYSSSIETAIAKNKNTNIKTLNKLFKDEYYHDSLAENPNFSSRLLRKLVFPNQDEDILQAIARNPSINRKLIDALFHVKEEVSGEEYDFINIALADNKNTPPYILDTFIEDFNKNGWLVDEEMNKNSYLLKKLSKHADNYVRLSVACNYATPEEVLNTLCNDNDSTIRSVAFMNLYFKCSINEDNITHQIN